MPSVINTKPGYRLSKQSPSSCNRRKVFSEDAVCRIHTNVPPTLNPQGKLFLSREGVFRHRRA